MAFPKIGNLAPAFTLTNQKGEPVSLKQFKGKQRVVLYFYPKAMTPGCTVQACGIRDTQDAWAEHDAVVLAVSPDSAARLQKFDEKETLGFTLLSDPDHQVADAYGAWGKKKFMGKEVTGILRTTFIIGRDGKLKHIIDKVKTKTHHEDVLAILATLED